LLAKIPPGGRFIVVDGAQELYWENVSRVLHLVPVGYNCSACGCSSTPAHIAKKVANELPQGLTFNCSMIDGSLLLLGAPSPSTHIYWVIGGAAVLIIGVAIAFCVLRGGKKKKRAVTLEEDVEKPSRGLVRHSMPEQATPVRMVSQPIWVAPPRYAYAVVTRPLPAAQPMPPAEPVVPDCDPDSVEERQSVCDAFQGDHYGSDSDFVAVRHTG